jgi:hypothetical protein
MVKMGGNMGQNFLNTLARAKGAGQPAVLTMLPEMGAFRYSDTYTAESTVLARPYSVSAFDFTPTPFTNPGAFPAGESMFFMSRSVLQNTFRYVRNEVGAPWEVHSRRFEAGSLTPFQHVECGGSILLDYTHMVEAGTILTGLVAPNTWNPTHSDPGVGEYRAMFINATAARPTALNVIRGNVSTVDWELRLLMLRGTEWSEYRSSAFPAANGSFTETLTETGYYAIELVTPALIAGPPAYDIYLTVAGTCGVWRIDPIPGFDQHYQSIGSIRLNAASLLLSPDCAESERAGRVSAVQLPSGSSWFSYARPNALASLADTETTSFVKGAYGYIKPSSDLSYALRNVVHRGNTGLVVSVQEALTEGTDTIAFYVTVPMSSQISAYPASTIHITAVVGCEYTTQSVWVEAHPPTMSSAEFAQSVAIIRSLPQFFENETHGEAIMRYLRAGVRGAKKYGPAALEIASLIAKMLG